MAVASHKYASTILLIVLLTAPFICILTCGLVIPTLCPMVRRSTPCRATMVKSCTVNNQNVSDGFYGRSLLTSFSGSVGDTGAIMELDEGGRPPLEASFYEENFFDKFMLNFFRGLLQNEIGYVSPLEGFGGLIDEAQNYYVKQGASPEEMQNMVVRLLTAISGPMLPLLYRILIAPGPWAPLATALVTPYILKFLVGPSTVAPRRDGKVCTYHVKEYPLPKPLCLMVLLCPDSLEGCTLRDVNSWRQLVARDYA